MLTTITHADTQRRARKMRRAILLSKKSIQKQPSKKEDIPHWNCSLLLCFKPFVYGTNKFTYTLQQYIYLTATNNKTIHNSKINRFEPSLFQVQHPTKPNAEEPNVSPSLINHSQNSIRFSNSQTKTSKYRQDSDEIVAFSENKVHKNI